MTAELQRYYGEIYGGPDSTPVDAAQFAPPAGRFLVGYVDGAGQPVAMGGWRFVCDPALPGRRPAEVKRMYVVPAARGRGAARALLAELERTARAAGADLMVLETGRAQPDAIGLYRSSGYADIPRFGHYACAPGAIHLGKPLPSRRGGGTGGR